MNLSLVDWAIIIAFFLFIAGVATFTRRYVRGVADFLAANRCAGRYMLSVSDAVANLGAISLIAFYEAGLQTGFTYIWWSNLMTPFGILIVTTGWIIYRYRQSRVLTLAELFERRYSKKFRLFMGVVMFVSGTLNFGIFPAIGSKFFMYFCGFPSYPIQLFNVLTVDLTFAAIMGILLTVSLYFTFMGGQIAIMLTDFLQGIFTTIILGVVAAFVIIKIGWDPIEELILSSPDHFHMIHPLRGQNIPDFNIGYFIMLMVLTVYFHKAWQGSQGYGAAPLNPHEAKMGGLVGLLRGQVLLMSAMLLPVIVYVILRAPSFAGIAEQANSVLGTIDNDTLKSQMTVPIVMKFILNKGILGCFAALFLAAFISTHDTYLHSWGSIFVQDIVMPFRKKPFTQKQHIFLLKASIVAVALFAFIFSLLWTQTEAILLWFQLTGAIYLGGAGAVLIGSLYWKRGTTMGAYSAMITGMTLAMSGIVIQQAYMRGWWGLEGEFLLNGMQISFVTAIASSLVYVIVSLVNNRVFDLDKLLHHGKYAVAEDVVEGNIEHRGVLMRFFAKFGLTKEFNRRDKFVFFMALGYTYFWFFIFLFGTIYNFAVDVKPASWMKYWKYYTMFTFVVLIVHSTWMIIGGTMDIKKMFNRLKTVKRNEQDDGWVQSRDTSDVSEKDHFNS